MRSSVKQRQRVAAATERPVCKDIAKNMEQIGLIETLCRFMLKLMHQQLSESDIVDKCMTYSTTSHFRRV